MNNSSAFSELAETLERIRSTSSKNEKVYILSKFLRCLGPNDLRIAVMLCEGRVSPRGGKDEVQIGYSSILDVLLEICNIDQRGISRIYVEKGDLGEVTFEALSDRREVPLIERTITLAELEESFQRISQLKGKGSNTQRKLLLKSLLLRSSKLEAKYIVKILTGEMRTGLVHGLLEEAIAKAFLIPKEKVGRAHLLLGDLSLVALKASEGKIDEVRISPMRPINFMLAEPIADENEIIEHFMKSIYAEFKYDGIRAQLHKFGETVKVYSRRLEDITASFPEIEDAAKKIKGDFIIDGEIIAYSNNKPLPFQMLQRRLRRIEAFDDISKIVPVRYLAFDLLYKDGNELYDLPLRDRISLIRELVDNSYIFEADRYPVSSAEEIRELFELSRKLGYEGLVIKDPDSKYTIGKRGASWVKLKEELDTIDAVIVGAEYGHGKRAGVISDYTFAVRDGDSLKVIGKAYSGLTDEEIKEMTERIKSIIIEDYGYKMIVKPEIVIEVAFDSIQKSKRHDSGYALRFPRIKRIRDDKSLNDIDTLDKVIAIYNSQRLRAEEA